MFKFLKGVAAAVVVFAFIVAIVGGCVLSCRTILQSPANLTEEETRHVVEMNDKLSRATTGDFLLLRDVYDYALDDRAIWTVRWHNKDRKEAAIASLTGGFCRVFFDEIDARIEDVILKDDPRWPEYRDRLIFGKTSTSQPTTAPSN